MSGLEFGFVVLDFGLATNKKGCQYTLALPFSNKIFGMLLALILQRPRV